MKSLFIGRYQLFHEGHKKLMEVELKEGNDVVIAIRDTEISEKNPYSIEDREEVIHEAMKEWEGRYDVILIPDIERVCYGREVGWDIRQIKLDDETEAISATKIREELESDT